jgi:bifunctional non-homologous end joining protein LigD
MGSRDVDAEEPDVAAALAKGELRFSLDGTKLHGDWVLIRFKGPSWLLIKQRDSYASTAEVTGEQPFSVLSNRSMAEIANAAS